MALEDALRLFHELQGAGREAERRSSWKLIDGASARYREILRRYGTAPDVEPDQVHALLEAAYAERWRLADQVSPEFASIVDTLRPRASEHPAGARERRAPGALESHVERIEIRKRTTLVGCSCGYLHLDARREADEDVLRDQLHRAWRSHVERDMRRLRRGTTPAR